MDWKMNGLEGEPLGGALVEEQELVGDEGVEGLGSGGLWGLELEED